MNEETKLFLIDLLYHTGSAHLQNLLNKSVDQERYEHSGLIGAEILRRVKKGLMQIDDDGNAWPVELTIAK